MPSGQLVLVVVENGVLAVAGIALKASAVWRWSSATFEGRKPGRRHVAQFQGVLSVGRADLFPAILDPRLPLGRDVAPRRWRHFAAPTGNAIDRREHDEERESQTHDQGHGYPLQISRAGSPEPEIAHVP